jgi:hypothetical protein
VEEAEDVVDGEDVAEAEVAGLMSGTVASVPVELFGFKAAALDNNDSLEDVDVDVSVCLVFTFASYPYQTIMSQQIPSTSSRVECPYPVTRINGRPRLGLRNRRRSSEPRTKVK